MALALPATQTFIAYDDLNGTLGGLELDDGDWVWDDGDFYFGHLIIWPDFSKNNKNKPRGSLTYTFEGTSLRIFGHTAPAGNNQSFQIKIDSHEPYNTSTDDQTPMHYRQWYQSPELSDGEHTIKVDQLEGQRLDFMVITPSSHTSLNGRTLMVDDTYTGIHYSQNWQMVSNSTFIKSWIWGGSNFMNTTHTTTTVGDAMTFSYTGTAASVYGVFLREQVGSLTFTYSIDGGTNFSSSLISSGNDGSDTFVNQEPNYKLFETGPLSAGNHTLTMTLTACIGQTLIVDYILYTPSFANLASMPNITASSTTAGETGISTPSPNKKINTGAVAGGVVGGVALLVIVALFLWWLRRRRPVYAANSQQKRRPEPLSQLRNSVSHNDQFNVEPFSAAPTSGSALPMSAKPGMISAYNPSTSSVTATIVPTPITAFPNQGLESENEQLRNQVQQLAAENARLTVQAVPPAYN